MDKYLLLTFIVYVVIGLSIIDDVYHLVCDSFDFEGSKRQLDQCLLCDAVRVVDDPGVLWAAHVERSTHRRGHG